MIAAMLAWARNALASLVVKEFLGWIASIVVGSAILHEYWDSIATSQPAVIATLAVLAAGWIVVPGAWFLHRLLFRVPEGRSSPQYLYWYALPIWRVSWNLAGYLALTTRDTNVYVMGFQTNFAINRGDGIRPIRAYIESRRAGFRQDVLVECGNPYVRAEEIEYMPRGKIYHCQARFERDGHGDHSEGLPADLFLHRFDDLRFVFEYEEGRFEHVFPRRQLEDIINSVRRRAIGRPAPTPRRRAPA